MTSEKSKLLDKGEVAEILKCCTRQVDYLRQKQGLPFIKLGTLIRFKLESVLEWLDKTEETKINA